MISANASADNADFHATAAGSVATTDNVNGSETDPQGSLFTDVRPGMLFTYNASRMIHELTTEVDFFYYFGRSQPNVTFRGDWKAFFLTGPRSELSVGANGSFGQLNALQAAEIEKANDNVQNGSRGKVRDAATLFDENTALLIVRDNEWLDAFRTHRWHEVFIERRETFWQNCEVWLFGHALMDKLTAPYKAITAHAWPLVADPAFFEMSFHDKRCWLDDTVASQLESGVVTSDFTPLPILGIPNWWTGQDDAFYADTAVFRPRRTRK